jgi:DNA polymerase-3 subunit alpha
VLPPDVNESEWKFTPVSREEIRFGLGALRGVGAVAVNSILEARAKDGIFKSLFDLVDRVDLRVVGKRVLEALIQAGACDKFGHRSQLMAGLDVAIREAQIRAEELESGQGNLFGDAGPANLPRQEPLLPDVPRWSEAERLAREKEVLGFFISGHPLEKYRDEVRIFDRVNTASLKQYKDQKIELPCVVTAVSRQISKKNGAEWGRITIEDFFGTATVLAFGDVWDAYSDILVQDAAVLVRGQVSGRERDEEDPPVFLDSAIKLGSLRTSGQVGVELRLSQDGTDPELVAAASEAFRKHPGPAPVLVGWQTGQNGDAARMRSRQFSVDLSEELIGELRRLFGPERIRLVRV